MRHYLRIGGDKDGLSFPAADDKARRPRRPRRARALVGRWRAGLRSRRDGLETTTRKMGRWCRLEAPPRRWSRSCGRGCIRRFINAAHMDADLLHKKYKMW